MKPKAIQALANPKRRRKTLAGEIKMLSDKDWLEAITLAMDGEKFTKLQTYIRGYLDMKSPQNPNQHQKIKKTVNPLEFEVLETIDEYRNKTVPILFELIKKELCAIFLSALDSKDADKLHEIADAVEFLKQREQYDRDPLRASVLIYKRGLELRGETMTIAKLAQCIKFKADAVDGYSRLRKICKELAFPISPSSKISTKKGLKKLR